jgi:uncharacterized short protein YbdD (DUF466 family)
MEAMLGKRTLGRRLRWPARRLGIGSLGARLKQAARLMVGIPDYDAYLEHCRRAHPGQPVMSYADFFRASQDRRYGGVSRCC